MPFGRAMVNDDEDAKRPDSKCLEVLFYRNLAVSDLVATSPAFRLHFLVAVPTSPVGT